MADTTITRDSQVEVSSEEEGFKGAWFKATLLDNPTKSGRAKLRISYMTLLQEDGVSPLTELADQNHVRPLPPENLYDEVVFQEGLVVDADHKDGWWTGVVLKQMEDDDGNQTSILHQTLSSSRRNILDPILSGPVGNGSHHKSRYEELDKSMFSVGTMVEVRSATDKVEVSWFPAMMIKEIEEDDKKKFVVKECNKRLGCDGDEASPNIIVDVCRVRPTPPPLSCKEYELLQPVEAFRGGSGWRQGVVRGILADKCYMVRLEASKEENVYKHSALRPLMVWEDGVWHDRSEPEPVEETPSDVVNKKPVRSSTRAKAKPMTPKTVAKPARRFLNADANGESLANAVTVAVAGKLRKTRADDVVIDKTQPVIALEAIAIAKKSIPPVTPSPVIPVTTLRGTETESGGKQSVEKTPELVENENGSGNDSTSHTMPREESSKDTTRKRKREEKHNSCLEETELSSDECPNVVDNAAAVTRVDETPAKDTVTVLPFAKKSPFWKKYETNEEYKLVPQSPHFSPLAEVEDDIRDWSAVGMMVTFYGLLEEVKNLQPDVSSSKLVNLSSSLAKLEKYGFDVAMLQSRIDKVACLQDERAKKVEERKRLQNEIEGEKSGRNKIEEETAELERRILDLKENKEAADRRIVEMESCAGTTDQEIKDLVLEFHTTVSAPW